MVGLVSLVVYVDDILLVATTRESEEVVIKAISDVVLRRSQDRSYRALKVVVH